MSRLSEHCDVPLTTPSRINKTMRIDSTMKSRLFSTAVAAVFAACGGGADDAGVPNEGATLQPASAPVAAPSTPSGPMLMPDWYGVDHDAKTVRLAITAGTVPDNNYWNSNGRVKGELAITVPEGYTVTIDFKNQDPIMAHSLGIWAELRNFAMPPAAEAVFAGAITENPLSMIDGTMPGETETIEFVADVAGEYSMICYIAGHTTLGMWLYFNVSATGHAGVQGL
jgi:FtsP/CotA-like multicopper oxidase with cupredoxin domain